MGVLVVQGTKLNEIKMTRETYIQIRKSNNLILLAYNHYYEKCLEKGQNPLDFSVFNEWFPRYIGAQHIIDSLISYYDNLFEVTIIEQINIELQVEKRINIL